MGFDPYDPTYDPDQALDLDRFPVRDPEQEPVDEGVYDPSEPQLNPDEPQE